VTAARDGGYALVAAVAAMAAFSLIALEILAGGRGWDLESAAQIQRAKLEAAADAGVMAAVHGLAAEKLADRWAIDGRPRPMGLGDVNLIITIEDERGKVPINELSEDQVRDLFSAAGISGDRLDILVDSFEDWTGDAGDPRPNGAQTAYYQPFGLRPRNGALRTVDELIHVRGMDLALFSRLAPSLTVNFGESGGFDASTAQPFAVKVMEGGGADTVDAIERERKAAGQSTALAMPSDESLVGRILTVRVVATDAAHGQFERSELLELTGDKANPYWVRVLNG
jgi:general secretion pathway protein K